MAEHNDLGKYGEELAAQYLQGRGYTIIARDWRFGRCKKDIDIRARSPDQATVVFVGVKTRRPNELVPAMKAIDRKKMMNLVRAAKAYLQFCEVDMEVQFDIVTVIIDEAGEHVEHIPDAFLPPLKSYR